MAEDKKGKWIQVVDPDGVRGEIHESEAYLLNQGFRQLSPEELEQEFLNEQAESVGGMGVTATEALARGVSFGLSDHVLTQLGVSKEEIKRRKKVNPNLSLGSEFVGDIGSLIIGGAAIKGLGFAGKQAGKLALKKSLKRAALRGAAEGAVLEAGDIISETALDENPNLTAENVIKRVGGAALLGSVIDPSVTAGMRGVSNIGKKLVSESSLARKAVQKMSKKGMELVGVTTDIGEAYQKALIGPKKGLKKQREAFKEMMQRSGGLPGLQQTIKEVEEEFIPGKKLIDILDSPLEISGKADEILEKLGEKIGNQYRTFDESLARFAQENPHITQHIKPQKQTLYNELTDLSNQFKKSPDLDVKKFAKRIEKQRDAFLEAIEIDDSFENFFKERVKFDKNTKKFVDEVSTQGTRREIRNAMNRALFKDMESIANKLDEFGINPGEIRNIPSNIQKMNRQASIFYDMQTVLGDEPYAGKNLNIFNMLSNWTNWVKYGGATTIFGPGGTLAALASDFVGPKLPNIMIHLTRNGVKLPKVPTAAFPKSVKQFLNQSTDLGKAALKQADVSQVAMVSAMLYYGNKVEGKEKEEVKQLLKESTDILEDVSNTFQKVEADELVAQLEEINKEENKKIGKIINKLGKKETKKPKFVSIDKYDKIAKQVKELDDNPENFMMNMDNISQYMAHPAPTTTLQLQAKMVRIGEFLVEKLPRSVLGTPSTLFPREVPITNAHKQEFMKYYTYALDPNSALDELSNGNIDKEAIETLRALYPDTLQKLVNEVVANADKLKDMPFEKRKALSIALNMPIDISFQYITELQQAFVAQDQAPETVGISNVLRKHNFKGSKATEVEKISKS